MAFKIDCHQHFWKYSKEEYGWIDESMKVIKCDHLPEDLQKVQEPLQFNGSVAVQARQTLEETRWLLELADNSKLVKGVVGWLDLRSEKIEEQLMEFASHPKLVGIRHVIQDEPDDAFILGEDFKRGISYLEKHNLVYDILIFAKHLPNTVQFVKQFPNQVFVLNHIAKPDIKGGEITLWEQGIRDLAKFPNVHCKLSGMVTEADWKNWTAEDLKPYLDVVFDAFGPERLMIGSDWPVCKLAGNYHKVMNIVIKYIENLNKEEQEAVLGENAINVYGLKM
nr:amidohydrolase family protein [uncultured Marinifilum sp.]